MSKVKRKDVPKVLDLLLAYMTSTNSIATALRETGDTFRQYKGVLESVADDIERNGTDLRVALKKQDVFSEEVTQLLNAGSTSGKLTEVIPEVSKSLKYLITVSSGIVGAVAFQGGLLLVMIMVAPYLIHLVAGQSSAKTGTIIDIKIFIDAVMGSVPMVEYLYPIGILGIALALAFYQPARVAIIQVISLLPMINKAITNYQTGSWCRYVSMMANAGIRLNEAERMLRGTLLPGLAEAFQRLVGESEKGWTVATTFDEDDPRARIPRVVLAFIKSGGHSGNFDSQLSLAAEYQLEEATKQFQTITKIIGLLVMNVVAGGVLALGSQVYMSRF